MINYFFVILAIIIFLIIIGTVVGLKLSKSKYFDDVIRTECPEIRFFIKKHTIFRFFSLAYAVIHYSLNIVAIMTSFITVYMVIDFNMGQNTRIIFLLTASITTNIVLGLRVDKISETYAQAMRILENAILKYLLAETTPTSVLYEANEEAEQLIGNKFF
ncbi:MAG: hypothetical protein NC243_04020 [Lachnoclostridium sp.]|nr:hypothetical protein [Lachnoclostridium sp.]MCM1383695.1 hypothetical protein [Lachnoclostridium sp.]